MLSKNKTPITHILEDEWLPVLKTNRRTLSKEHVFCRMTCKKNKEGMTRCFIKLSIGYAIAELLEYKERQNLLVTINRTRPNLYLVKKVESGGYITDKNSTPSPSVVTLDFPVDRSDILPLGKTVAVTFDIFNNNSLIFDISKIVEY